MVRRTSVVVAVACVAMIAGACGRADDPASRGEAGSPRPPASSESAGLAFSGTTLTDKRFDGSTLAGKDALLWFWTPWCPKCAREATHIAAAQTAHGTRVAIVGVPAYGTVDEMRTFAKNFKVERVTHVADPDAKIWRQFNVTQQPAYAFIDQSGAVEVVRGEIGPGTLEAKLKELMAK